MPVIFRPSDFSVDFVIHLFNSPIVYIPIAVYFPPLSIFQHLAFHSICGLDTSSSI